jgi:hypothetical protein
VQIVRDATSPRRHVNRELPAIVAAACRRSPRCRVRRFEITPEQEEIRRLCRDFAANEIRPVSLAVDEADTEVPWEVLHRAAEIGLTSFMLPEWLGGGGMTDCLTGCIVQEELSHGCAGIGNPDHLERLLRRAAARARGRGPAAPLARAWPSE